MHVEFDLSNGTREMTRDILLAYVLAIAYVLQCRHIKIESETRAVLSYRGCEGRPAATAFACCHCLPLMPCAASRPRVSLGWGHRGQPRAKRCLPYLPFSHRCRVTGNEHIAYLAYLTYLLYSSYLGAGSLGAAEGAEALAVLTLLTMLALLTLYSLQTPYSGGVYLLTVRTILIIPTVLTTYDRAGLVEWRGRRTT